MSDNGSDESPPGSPTWPYSLSNFPLSLRSVAHPRMIRVPVQRSLPLPNLSSTQRAELGNLFGDLDSFEVASGFLNSEATFSSRDRFMPPSEEVRPDIFAGIEAQASAHRDARSARQVMGTMLGDLPNANANASTKSKAKDKGSSVTLVTALPPTSYKDEEDSYRDRDNTKGKVKTLAYYRVQRHVLKYLKTRAADAVDAQQVASWTQEIDYTGGKEPTAEEAVRLCHYMHSQGFDVYAKFVRQKILCLYLVNQKTYTRSRETDILYWRQNMTTDEVEYAASSNRRSRRNAVPNVFRTEASSDTFFAEDNDFIASVFEEDNIQMELQTRAFMPLQHPPRQVLDAQHAFNAQRARRQLERLAQGPPT